MKYKNILPRNKREKAHYIAYYITLTCSYHFPITIQRRVRGLTPLFSIVIL